MYPDREGYYWVKTKWQWPEMPAAPPLWEAAYWRDEEYWELIGREGMINESEIIEIGPELIRP